jgi:hypothetical protein
VTSKATEHAPEALFSKALVYVGQMENYSPADWRHRLWASLSLELLARAALANISPTLLADRKNWQHLSRSGPLSACFRVAMICSSLWRVPRIGVLLPTSGEISS